MRGSLRRWTLRYPSESMIRFESPPQLDLRRGRPTITVAIPHFEAPEWCVSTVESFLGQEGVEVTVVVVDNSPNTGLVLPDGVQVIARDDNPGYAGAINHVLERWLTEEHADGRYFVAACHDCKLEPQALSLMSAAFESDPMLGIAGPSTSDTGAGGGGVSGSAWVSGACLMLSQSCAAELRNLDEELGTYDEDVDLCLRAWDAGWRVGAVAAGTVVTHGSVAQDRIERISRNHVLLAAKRRGVIGALLEAGLQWRRSLISGYRAIGGGGWESAHAEEARQRLRGATAGLSTALSNSFHRPR
jgi:GT2 family glycosyltransferase